MHRSFVTPVTKCENHRVCSCLLLSGLFRGRGAVRGAEAPQAGARLQFQSAHYSMELYQVHCCTVQYCTSVKNKWSYREVGSMPCLCHIHGANTKKCPRVPFAVVHVKSHRKECKRQRLRQDGAQVHAVQAVRGEKEQKSCCFLFLFCSAHKSRTTPSNII